jgi:putative membrane protein
MGLSLDRRYNDQFNAEPRAAPTLNFTYTPASIWNRTATQRSIVMKRIQRYTASVVLTAFISIPALALDGTDRNFATQAAIADLAEIELANLAKQKARNEGIQQYADHLLQDHQQSSEKLKALAAQKNITLPTDLDAKHKADRDKLAALDGPEFEKAYVDAMIKDHRKAIGTYQNESKKTKDADFKAFTTEVEPKLREHLGHAQKLQSQHTSNASR